jgi:hypothetical protein
MSHCLGKKQQHGSKVKSPTTSREVAQFLRQARLESMNIDPDVAPWPSKNGCTFGVREITRRFHQARWDDMGRYI